MLERFGTNKVDRSNTGAINGRPVTAAAPVFEPRVVGKRVSEVEPEKVEWLWPGRVPYGKLTLLCGDPGLGKSFATLDIAARLSSGTPWPDAREKAIEPGNTVILSAEDGLADTIRPRLDAAHAEVARIHCVQGVEHSSNGEIAHLDLSEDLRSLERYIQEQQARLCIIDPISAYLCDRNSHNNSDIRGVLGPLASLAERQACAVIAVTHLNKCTAMAAMYRSIGSVAFVAQARMVWAVCRDPHDPDLRLLLPLKSNLTKDAPSLAFRLVDSDTPEIAMVAWSEGPADVDVNDVLGSSEVKNRKQCDEAVDWLQTRLSDGPVDVAELKEAARTCGVAWRTLERAKKTLRVESFRTDFGSAGNHRWRLS